MSLSILVVYYYIMFGKKEGMRNKLFLLDSKIHIHNIYVMCFSRSKYCLRATS